MTVELLMIAFEERRYRSVLNVRLSDVFCAFKQEKY